MLFLSKNRPQCQIALSIRAAGVYHPYSIPFSYFALGGVARCERHPTLTRNLQFAFTGLTSQFRHKFPHHDFRFIRQIRHMLDNARVDQGYGVGGNARKRLWFTVYPTNTSHVFALDHPTRRTASSSPACQVACE